MRQARILFVDWTEIKKSLFFRTFFADIQVHVYVLLYNVSILVVGRFNIDVIT